ncbi:glycoprotein 3-alpha-L-fucosyltransferase A-like [Dysidea avara]|uniref:glycoprotein 3-alpha-L-fucosyltransferase A-like n=1 Tax=Dysidea avara TaxID=196820 RepID=UPI00332EEE1D
MNYLSRKYIAVLGVIGVIILICEWNRDFNTLFHNEDDDLTVNEKDATQLTKRRKKNLQYQGYESCHRATTIPRKLLCSNNSTNLTIFSIMERNLIRQYFAHNEEAKDCRLTNGQRVYCNFTADVNYFRTADVLYIRECFSYCMSPAYSDQLTIRYNRGPEKRECCGPQNIKLSDIRVSYTLESTIPFPFMCWPDIQQPVLDALHLPPPKGRHGIAMFVTDCIEWRLRYLKELMKYIHINSFGKCLHNTEDGVSRHRGTDLYKPKKQETILRYKYKFLLTFESTVIVDYVSEKIWHGYMSQTVPIYYGTKDVYDQAPGANTFIDATKFAGPKELAEYIKKVDRDDDLYRSFFNFDIEITRKFQEKHCPPEPLGCAMCKELYQLKQKRCATKRSH